MKRHILSIVALIAVVCLVGRGALAQGAPATAPATQPSGKVVRILTIGNSFSWNAIAHLRAMAKAGGHELIHESTSISGSSMERHLTHARKHEEDPTDPAGMPYAITLPDGTKSTRSLKQALLSKEWDYVTIQQVSSQSYKLESFRPHAKDLADYVHKYAPNAKLVIHETWAYRGDHPLFKDGKLTPQEMYERLHENYATIASELNAVGIIPVGTAFQIARAEAGYDDGVTLGVDLAAFTNPELPPQPAKSLILGYYWRQRAPSILILDAIHASAAGKYLGSCVWYEYFFGDLEANPYMPRDLPSDEANLLKTIALKAFQVQMPVEHATRD